MSDCRRGHPDKAFLIAGTLARVAGLLAFLLIHHFWITPIWFILPLGLLISGVGGLALGWSYSEIGHRLPERPWRTLAVVSLIMMILLPSLLLGELRQPMFTVSAAGVANLAMGIPEAVVRFIGELLLTATITGGLLGWWLGRTRRAASATALAGFVFALGPGHNIPSSEAHRGWAKRLRSWRLGAIAAVAMLFGLLAGPALVARFSLTDNPLIRVVYLDTAAGWLIFPLWFWLAGRMLLK